MRLFILVLTLLLFLNAGCLESSEPTYPEIDKFEDLFQSKVMIATCDPNHCPAGRYAYSVISSLEAKNPVEGRALRKNIVTNDPNVRAVLDKVVTREVDAGFVYITDAVIENIIENDSLDIIEIPRELSPLPQYGAAVILDGENPEGGMLFTEYLTSDEAQGVLERFGFTPGVESPEPFEPEKLDPTVGGSITVYAASSLTDVFEELSRNFQEETGINVILGFGSSGTLRAKIEGGAPADVFVTASLRHTEILKENGFIEGEEVFVRNRLVVITRTVK